MRDRNRPHSRRPSTHGDARAVSPHTPVARDDGNRRSDEQGVFPVAQRQSTGIDGKRESTREGFDRSPLDAAMTDLALACDGLDAVALLALAALVRALRGPAMTRPPLDRDEAARRRTLRVDRRNIKRQLACALRLRARAVRALAHASAMGDCLGARLDREHWQPRLARAEQSVVRWALALVVVDARLAAVGWFPPRMTQAGPLSRNNNDLRCSKQNGPGYWGLGLGEEGGPRLNSFGCLGPYILSRTP